MFSQEVSSLTGAQVIVPRGPIILEELTEGEARFADQIYPPIPPSDDESECSLETARRHTYRPLDRDEIRLLILNPGSGSDPIECYVEHYPIDKAKPFQAVSYVWGPEADGELTVLLDGCPVPVTENLHAFLRAFRTEHECPVLWVDALCINQGDFAERAAQVRLMKRVYEGADEVVIWLGEALPSTGLTFERVRSVYDTWWLPRLEREGGSVGGALSSITKADEDLILTGLSGQCPDWMDGLRDLLDRPWWTRIWVYQEATAPARQGATAVCGRWRAPFQTLLAANQIGRRLVATIPAAAPSSSQLGTNSKTSVNMHVYSELRRRYQLDGWSHFLRLADLLPALRGYDATNPRDKLYALIPSSLDGAELLDIDYSLSVVDIYTNAAWAFIQKHRNLNVLGHCWLQDEGFGEFVLPSWVPDWTARSTPMPFFKRSVPAGIDPGSFGEGIGEDVALGSLYSASKGIFAEAELDKSRRKLRCSGILVDLVKEVSPSAGERYDGVDAFRGWKLWLEEIKRKMHLQVSNKDFDEVTAAGCYRVAVDIGVRWGGDDSVPPAVKLGNDCMDMTGRHPATFLRRLIVTEKGHLGLAPKQVRRGDSIVVLLGGQMPYILREIENHHILAGEAYICGYMDGEALESGGKELGMFEIW